MYEKPSHWDFMLEVTDVLRTWELRELPASWATALGQESDSNSIVAHPLADHRLAYLDYEGQLSGDRGSVRRCDAGDYRIVDQADDALTVELHGTKLQGLAQLATHDAAWILRILTTPGKSDHVGPDCE